MSRIAGTTLLFIGLSLGGAAAKSAPAVVVALGASQTYGKGVARNEAYPAQLEQMLRADGFNARVLNLGLNGTTTGEMLGRLSSVPRSARVVILQPGGNDKRVGQMGDRAGNIAEAESRLEAQGAKVIMIENSEFRAYERGPDGQHLTPEGYRSLAQNLLSQVESALGR